MKNEFIPYEQALALKELEFNEPCFGFYNPTITKDVIINNDSYGGFGLMQDHIVVAPTYSQAFRWFRENHKLHNGIYPYYDEYEFQIKDFRLPTNTPINGGLMAYEEAELACLDKLIEIKKNDK